MSYTVHCQLLTCKNVSDHFSSWNKSLTENRYFSMISCRSESSNISLVLQTKNFRQPETFYRLAPFLKDFQTIIILKQLKQTSNALLVTNNRNELFLVAILLQIIEKSSLKLFIGQNFDGGYPTKNAGCLCKNSAFLLS